MSPNELLSLFILTAALLCPAYAPPISNTGSGSPTGKKVILLLFDGYRWDYPDLSGMTGFKRLESRGVRAEYLIPEFPTNTYPNHFTIDTGRHVENHGLIDNYAYDPENKTYFSESNPNWWQGAEPIWVTAKKQGKRTHMFYWLGCEHTIHGLNPDQCVLYPAYGHVKTEPFKYRMEESLDLIQNNQTDLVGLYIDHPDHTGHFYGVYSERHNASLREMDGLLNYLMDELESRELTDSVDVLLMSDHGMTNSSRDRLIYLSDYISVWYWYWIDIKSFKSQCAAVFLWPKRPQEIMTVYSMLRDQHPHMRVFLKQHYSDVENWYFQHHNRTPPILLLADPGWCIIRPLDVFIEGGVHGYDNNAHDMRTIFMAFGPDFKPNTRTPPIHSVDIYQLICKLLGIKPSPHDGHWDHVAGMLNDL